MTTLPHSSVRRLCRLFFGASLLVAACGDDGSAECAFDEECAGALVCEDGQCQRAGCTVGTEGCACGVGSRCVRGSDGEPLTCTEGVCTSPSCPAGEAGCVCIDGMTCAEGNRCASGFCVPDGCEPASDGCECLSGTCDVGLHCREGALCVDDDGYEGGPCLESGRCNPGARCDTTLDVCVYCELGSEGCACDEGACNTGLACQADLCIDGAQVPPVDPQCYTPCRDDLDGLTCDADELLPGCIDGDECNAGSCVDPGEAKPACASDLDCPFFQTCLSGGCYSNCESDIDCGAGLGCYNKVCRTRCESTTGSATCGNGWFCDAKDGENGFCIMLGDERGVGAGGEVEGGQGVTVSLPSLSFSNVRTSRLVDVGLRDEEPITRVATVRKLWHEITYADGTSERVELDRDPITGEPGACDAAAGECPLWWLELQPEGSAASREVEVTFDIIGGCTADQSCPSLSFQNAGGVEATRWTGQVEVLADGGRELVNLDYVERPDGQWAGSMIYFGSFADGGIDTWAGRTDKRDVSGVTNGLIRRWSAFRSGSLSGWDEWLAVIEATRTESWTFETVRERCPAADGACYPFTNTSGVRTFVSDLDSTPIPFGSSELPFAMNLRQPGLTATSLTGRIESAASLHYPGDPAVSLSVGADPSDASSCDPRITTNCVVWLDAFEAIAAVGGRTAPIGGVCPSGFTAIAEPWLVEGFTAGTEVDATGQRVRTICLDTELPLEAGSDTTIQALNRNLSRGNPAPDGRARRRTLQLLDGALVDQRTMFFFFRETFDDFVDDTENTAAYGYVMLRRRPNDFDLSDEGGLEGVPDVFEGNTPAELARPSTQVGASCDPQLLLDMDVSSGDIAGASTAELGGLVDALLRGTGELSASTYDPGAIHYFCEETGLFDGGANDDGTTTATSIRCPVGSEVTYFYAPSLSQADIAAEACQATVSCVSPAELPEGDDFELDATLCTGGSCQARLTELRLNGVIQEMNPAYTCTDSSTAYCDDDRLDLRSGKTFWSQPATVGRTFASLQAEIEAAFRYRTRFTSASGSRVGYAPRVCLPDSDQIPYCYDPPAIEEIRDRVDCLIAIYSHDRFTDTSWLSASRRSAVETFLRGDFSQYSDPSGTRDGFERLYSELLVMQGDEALTKAFASRFDLAGVGSASFRGSALEPGGIDLSGVAGQEMVNLYRAVQLYELALDRLYGLGPNLAETLSRNVSVDSPVVFLSAETVILYLERLIRASTQKARAFSEIAERYQGLARPGLARQVVSRAYASAYLEAALIEQLMADIASRAVSADQPQIDLAIETAQRRYRMALLDMRSLYGRITDDVNFFGFAPDYVPFPALDASAAGPDGEGPARNAFEILLSLAKQRRDLARVREQEALASNREFQTDAADFQAELVRLRNNYENQLLDICGSLYSEADDRVYPATRKYAEAHPQAQLMGDPCGLMGNGQIHSTLVQYQSALLDLQAINVRIENVFERVEIERDRASAQCDRLFDLADYQYESAGEVRDLNTDIADIRRELNLTQAHIHAGLLAAGVITSFIPRPKDPRTPDPDPNDHEPTSYSDIFKTLGGAAIRAAAQEATGWNAARAADQIANKEASIADIERETARWVTEDRCDALLIDSNALMESTLLSLRSLELESLRADYEARLLMSEVGRLHDEATRLQAQQEEAAALLVDVQAAKSDPNVRIYRNDAIVNADVAFHESLRAAYRATRVYEYLTSESYAAKEQLFLVRMVSSGDYNLDRYLVDLENAYLAFEERFGAPDTRVLQLSLMDDILQIPRIDNSGSAVSDEERYRMLREEVRDVDRLDENGYIRFGFSTTLDRLSPLTRNHTISRIEIEMAVTTGDHVGRIYLESAGTGVVRGLDDEIDYYVFPERTAVIQPYFNGNRVFDPAVYQSTRHEDRPLVNTNWQLVLNQRDELENKDILLDTLTDIRLYIYYEDYTR